MIAGLGSFPPLLVLVDQSAGAISQADLEHAAAVAEKHIAGTLCRAWGVYANLHLLGAGETMPAGGWPISICPHTKMDGALGYHDKSPLPYGTVGFLDSQGVGGGWVRTLLHEIDEMVVDPMCDDVKLIGSRLYSKEICDAVEDDDAGEETNLVLPSYYEPGSSGPWDALGTLSGPIPKSGPPPMSGGGYVSYLDVADLDTWKQFNARGPSARVEIRQKAAHPATRLRRRAIRHAARRAA